MKLRPILALLAGYVAWVVAFSAPVFVIASFWPALRAAGQLTFDSGRYDVYATSMLVVFQLMWLVANATAGFVTRLTSKRQLEVRWFAALLFAYFAYNHLWRLWGEMPTWYNLLIMVPVVPMVLAGSAMAERYAAARAASKVRPATLSP